MKKVVNDIFDSMPSTKGPKKIKKYNDRIKGQKKVKKSNDIFDFGPERSEPKIIRIVPVLPTEQTVAMAKSMLKRQDKLPKSEPGRKPKRKPKTKKTGIVEASEIIIINVTKSCVTIIISVTFLAKIVHFTESSGCVNMNRCPDCPLDFSRKDAMLRHRRNKHQETAEADPLQQQWNKPPSSPPPRIPPPPGSPVAQLGGGTNDLSEPTTLLHPFTMMISGPTACGKTTFVKDLLQHHSNRIRPGIQRIIYLYKRWQPMYDVIKAMVLPRVEFIRGIPKELDEDSYFNSGINNLLIMDDIASDTGKDKRITDLFTEGSHHRSLSVVSINQNLYTNKDVSQRRNSNYILLYNNPVDQQMVMTMARQMYPRNTDVFMKAFTKATKKPYGFLFIDLKPTTPEDGRLQSDVLWPDMRMRVPPSVPNMPIIPTTANVADHSREDCQNIGTENQQSMTHSCIDCGVIFVHPVDLHNHVKNWCPEGMKEEPPTKRMKMYLVDENAVYSELAGYARNHNAEERREKVAKYEKQGLSIWRATEKANQALLDEDLRAFMLKYAGLLSFIFKLNGGSLHSQIMDTVKQYLEREMDLEKAIRLSLKKYKHHFEMIVEEKENDIQDDDDDDNDDNDDDDSEDDE